MAKIVSQVWASARGSVGGITYFTTPAGAIIARMRNIPVAAPSNPRTNIKAAMITRAAQWNAMTQSQRNNWDTFAIAKGLISGRDAFLAGTIFLQYLLNSAFLAPTMQDNAPDNLQDPGVGITVAAPTTPGVDGVAITVKNNGGARVAVLFNISTGLNPARSFWKGPWDPNKTKANFIASGISSLVEFTQLTVGLRYFVRTSVITNDTLAGLRGAKLQTPVITNSIAVHVA